MRQEDEAFPSSSLPGPSSGEEATLDRPINLVKVFSATKSRDRERLGERVTDWSAKVQSKGVRINQMYWTLGQYDQVCIFDAPDDETAASVLLAADMLGNIRTRTMRAFTTSEMEKILSRVP